MNKRYAIPAYDERLYCKCDKRFEIAKAYYFRLWAKKKRRKKLCRGLKSAAGFIRRELGKRIDLRYTPEFVFELDDSIEHGANIERLLNNINKK